MKLKTLRHYDLFYVIPEKPLSNKNCFTTFLINNSRHHYVHLLNSGDHFQGLLFFRVFPRDF
jgi:hypothetical protein